MSGTRLIKYREHKCRGKIRLSLKFLQGKTSRDLNNNHHHSCVTKAMQGHFTWLTVSSRLNAVNQSGIETKGNVTLKLWNLLSLVKNAISVFDKNMVLSERLSSSSSSSSSSYSSSSFMFLSMHSGGQENKKSTWRRRLAPFGRIELQDTHTSISSLPACLITGPNYRQIFFQPLQHRQVKMRILMFVWNLFADMISWKLY